MEPEGHHGRRIPLVALILANAVSLVGSMVTVVALPWYVLHTTGSATKTGLTGFFVVLPGFAVGVLGGTLVDRLGFKRTSVLADLVSGVGIALIPLLAATVGLAFWQLLGLVFVGSLLEIPGLTARRSLLPEIGALARQPMERVSAAFEGNQYLSTLLGPPLAGVLIGWLGSANVLWLDAGSFVFSALVVALAVPGQAVRAVARRATTYRQELLAGLRFLWRDRLLRTLAIYLAVTNFFGSPFLAVLLPVFVAKTNRSATDLGVLIAASGAGSILGAIVFGAIGHRLPRRLTWIGAYSLFPLNYWVLATSPPLALAITVLALTGVIGGPLNPLLVTIRHERIPAALRGRVFSTFSAVSMLAAPLGMVAQGALLEHNSLTWTLVMLGVIYQVTALSMLVVPAMGEMERTRR